MTIVLLADDEVLAVVDDGEFAAGDFALVAGTYEEPDLEVTFDDLEIWDLVPLAAKLEGAFGVVPASTPAPTATATPIATPETE